MNRSATDTIKGYFYQFDYSIEKLLNLTNDTDEITVEGIEDIDAVTLGDLTAIQCKYYSKTEYNHSVIAKPIREMLTHFNELKKSDQPFIKYHLYGYYRSGQHKLTLPIDVDFLKDKILTYTASKLKKKHHESLGLVDADLEIFISLLSINIGAKEYEEQRNGILSMLKTIFSCDEFYAEYCLYNSALNEIRKLAIHDDLNSRKITKKEFLNRIDKKEYLFDKWFLELKGKQQYCKALKAKYFTSLNREEYERFFVIEVSDSFSLNSIKDLIYIISKKFSNLKPRETLTYCPYIYINNFSDANLSSLKEQLYDEGLIFIDGYPYHGSIFQETAITEKATTENKVVLKILSSEAQLISTIDHISKRREVYQFYISTPTLPQNEKVKIVNIQIEQLNDIEGIIK